MRKKGFTQSLENRVPPRGFFNVFSDAKRLNRLRDFLSFSRRRKTTTRFLSTGFTLIEVVIYIALFGLIMSGAFSAAYALMESAQRNATAFSIQQEGTFINRKLNWELTNAASVEAAGTHSVRIQPGNIVFAGQGSGMTIARGGNPALALSSSARKISDVDFDITPASSGRHASLRVSYTVDGKPFSFAKYLRQ